MILFKHFIITRFNLYYADWNKTRNNEPLLDDDWMNERIALFKNFCLPSVLGQSNKNFTWYIFLDEKTSLHHRAAIQTLLQPHSYIKSFFINGMSCFHEAVKENIYKDAAGIPYIITSRIDNDDCIHRDYVSVVQQHFQQQDFMALDVVKGYTLQMTLVCRLGKKEQAFNPFLSLIEKNESPKTVWHYKHAEWKKESRIIIYRDKRLWLSVIHNKNKVNEFEGYGNVDWKLIANEFSIPYAVFAGVRKKLVAVNHWQLMNLKNRLQVKLNLWNKLIKRRAGIYKMHPWKHQNIPV